MSSTVTEKLNTSAQVVEDMIESSSNVAFYHSEEFWVSVAFVLVVFG